MERFLNVCNFDLCSLLLFTINQNPNWICSSVAANEIQTTDNNCQAVISSRFEIYSIWVFHNVFKENWAFYTVRYLLKIIYLIQKTFFISYIFIIEGAIH